MKPRFLTTGVVKAMHHRLIDLFGGSHGLRDEGALESALAQAEQQFGGEYLHGDIAAMAAAYGFHVTKAHAFIDGNKRIGAACMGTFLYLNGLRFLSSEAETTALIIGVADGSVDKDQLTVWIRRNTGPRT